MKTKGNRKSKFFKNATKKNKTIKKSNKIKSCNEFCKNVYVYEIDKQNKELAKGSNVTYNPKIDRSFRLSTCKKNFCNKNCKKTYKYYDKESEKLFKKNMKNNFITNMRPELIETMKIKGAISYCDGFVYNPFNKNK
jgi:hypothetical protein